MQKVGYSIKWLFGEDRIGDFFERGQPAGERRHEDDFAHGAINSTESIAHIGFTPFAV